MLKDSKGTIRQSRSARVALSNIACGRSSRQRPTTQGFAARALLWLQLLTLAVGALQFAFVPGAVERPLLAAVALALLDVSMLLVRTVPALQRPLARQHWIDRSRC